MRFGVLGPLAVHDNEDRLIDVPSRMQRTVLAALLMAPNLTVSMTALTMTLWGESPPSSAANSVQNHVMRLRRLLGPEGGPRIRGLVGGYRIELADGDLDEQLFVGRSQRGRELAQAGRWADATVMLRGALELWRGDPLADLATDAFDSYRRWLNEMHMRTLRSRVHADLALGRHEDVVCELVALTAKHPLVETFHADLMLALYRCGRQADALAVHRRLRRMLHDELGVDPGRELTDLYRRVLAQDPALDGKVRPVVQAGDEDKLERLPPEVSDSTTRTLAAG